MARFTVIDAVGTRCSMDLEPIRNAGDELEWDLSPLSEIVTNTVCGPSLALPDFSGVQIQVEYDLTSPGVMGEHYEYGRFVIAGSAACDGIVREAVQVIVSRSTTEVSVSVPATVSRCAPLALDINVSVGGAYETYDNVLYFSTEDFEYIDDDDDPDFFFPVFAGLPDVGMPVARSTTWGTGPPVSCGSSATCPPAPTAPSPFPCGSVASDASTYARVVYDDKCGDDDTDNVDENSLVDTYSGGPALVYAADVSLTLTPETYFAVNDTAQWTLYAINGGSGDAYNLDLALRLRRPDAELHRLPAL